MNILYITHEMEFGGATLSLLGMIDQFRDSNKIYVLTRKKRGPLIEELKKRNVEIISMRSFSWLIPQNKRGIKGKMINQLHRIACGINYLQAIRLYKKVRSLHIDIIHTNCSVINIGALLSKISAIPHVWHIREFGKEDFDLSFVFSENYSYRFIQKYSNKIICVSDTLREKYIHFVDSEKVIRIYNGVYFPKIKERKFVRKGEYNLLISGRLSEAKGQEEAMEALQRLKSEGRDNIFLHLAGAGDLDFYRNKARMLGIENQVYFYGYTRDLNELRENMDIELICSKKEAFGRVTVEAMACGLPVIGANSGGTKELLEDGKTGILYEQGNIDDLALKIKLLLTNHNLRKKIALNGRNYARENFSVKQNAELVYECYQEVLKNDKKSVSYKRV